MQYYAAIDLKSFYASVECRERGLDPLKTNLAVTDVSRTEKTICLAVSPSLKSHGISGRARLFELLATLKEVNAKRRAALPYKKFVGKSTNADELQKNPALEIDFIAAPPRMALYMDYSARIYNVYLKYAAPEDIHVYSVDEVFVDITHYLKAKKMTPREYVKMMIKDVYETTGITAAAGIGTNLYLAKVAMDIMAKHVRADDDGVRIAELDEQEYRKSLWGHKPLTDFWRVGRGYAEKLEAHGMHTMGDVARASLKTGVPNIGEELLYKLFGVNAELLIDHAWGIESCTMKDIKAYKPSTSSIGSGQVLHCGYEFEKAKLIVREMTDALALDLVDKGLLTQKIVLTVGYDIENVNDDYRGELMRDIYGRTVPKHAHGTVNLEEFTSSTRELTDAAISLFDRIVSRDLFVRRINICASDVVREDELSHFGRKQVGIFELLEAENPKKEAKKVTRVRDKQVQSAVLDIKKRFGKNAIIKGMSLEDGATATQRNEQIGGHKA